MAAEDKEVPLTEDETTKLYNTLFVAVQKYQKRHALFDNRYFFKSPGQKKLIADNIFKLLSADDGTQEKDLERMREKLVNLCNYVESNLRSKIETTEMDQLREPRSRDEKRAVRAIKSILRFLLPKTWYDPDKVQGADLAKQLEDSQPLLKRVHK